MNLKPIFDTVRDMLGRGFTQAEVERLDRAIQHALGAGPVAPPMQTSKDGIELIHAFEGYAKKLPDGSVQAYPDPATGGKPWTIGWGSTTDEQGKAIQPGTVWSRERADRRFVQHLGQFEREVIAALGDSINRTSQQQFDALVSFTYNLGGANLRKSTLLKKHIAGDYAGAAAEFGKWVNASGKQMPGLVRRRTAEAKLYRGGQ